MDRETINIVIAGLGGQGVLTCAEILAFAAFLQGLDVKKAEIHGMSQRGASVTSDVRFGARVWSPMVSSGEADFLVVLSEDQYPITRHYLCPDGLSLLPSILKETRLANPKTLNTALLGALSRQLDFPEEIWLESLRLNLPQSFYQANREAFEIGRSLVQNKAGEPA